MRDARNYAAEELYDENDGGNDGGNGVGGIGDDIGDPTDADGNQLDDSQIRQIEAQVKIEVVQAAKAAKSVGKLPSSIERVVDQIVNVTTPWHDVLERFMVSKIKDGYSWSRPNRRFIAKNIYIPGTDYKPKMGKLVIGVDTSGSISQEVLNYFGGHINRILSTCNPESVIVVYCDAKVQAVDEYAPDDYPVQLVAHGGGGTSFKPVFDYIDNNNIEP